KDAADDDGVVGGIVVAEVAAGGGGGPAQVGAGHPALEEAWVEAVKKRLQIVMQALRRAEPFAAADLADEMRLGDDVLLADEAAIARVVDLRDGLPVEFAQQDMGERV